MTLVFTDLVGSVNIKRELGNVRALALLDQHDALVRAVLREFPDGVEISTAGDSFFLAFHRPSDAVGFGLRLQARLREWNRTTPVPVADRIGIHAGEVAVERNAQGGIHDLKGIEVDKCARVMSLARANQILLTSFAFENARAFLEGLPLPEIGEVSWVSHGPFRLKGVSETVEIFEVGQTHHAPLVAPHGANRKRIWGGAVVTAFVGLIALTAPPADPISNLSYDLGYMFRAVNPPTNAVLVVTDRESHEVLRQPRDQTWNREVHAQLVNRLTEHSARAIVFDVWFDLPDEERALSDAALVAAVQRHKCVAVAGFLQRGAAEGNAVVRWRPPFDELAAVVPWGVVYQDQEPWFVPRRATQGSSLAQKDSLAREVTRMLAVEPPPPYRELWLNYYGPPGTIPSLPYWSVVSNEVAPGALADKLVFVGDLNDEQVGPTGGWRTDEAPTPYFLWLRRKSPGVEILATETLNLLRRDWLRRLSPWSESGLVLLAGLLAGAGCARLRPLLALVVGGGSAALVGLVAMLQVWHTHVWFPWLVVSAIQIPVALLWSWVAWRTPAPRQGVVMRTATRLPDSAEPTPVLLPPAPPAFGATPAGLVRPAIPNYDLFREVGRGSYGQVWLARDTVGLWRAVKIVRRDSFCDARPYEREFAGIQQFTPISLEHPGLLRVLHVGRDPQDEYFFYVMELADPLGDGAKPGAAPGHPPGRPPQFDPNRYSARTLASDLKRQGALRARDVIRIGAALADALHFLHQHQLVHRDVKPANVLFVRGHPKLADIGLVTTMAGDHGRPSNLGTFGYMPPEGPGAASADVFGLGRLLYVAATASGPDEFPEFPADLDRRPDQPLLLKLSEIWCRACEPEAGRRYDSAAALAQALRALESADHEPSPV